MDTIKNIVRQLELCDFHCEAGSLSNNTAFIALKKYGDENYSLIKSPCELHGDFIGELCPVCMAAEIERLEGALDEIENFNTNNFMYTWEDIAVKLQSIARAAREREVEG
jgi:hypothetical protein